MTVEDLSHLDMCKAQGVVVAILARRITGNCGMISLKCLRCFSLVSVCPSEDIVGTKFFVVGTVTVEIIGKDKSQRVICHQAVSTVHTFQFLQLEPLLFSVITSGKQDKGTKGTDKSPHILQYNHRVQK
jgi:hypothetical protein